MKFKIETFEIDREYITVFLVEDNLGIEITIPKHLFNTWLCKTDRLDCEAVVNGEATTWKSDFDGYYDNSTANQVQQDLLDYITSNPIIYREETKLDSVASIKNAFAQAKKKRSHRIIFTHN